MSLRDFKTSTERQGFFAENLHLSLKNIKQVLVDNEEAIHCENVIGGISIPLGIAGPVKLKGRTEAYIPLATTEGALVASVQRGTKAINAEGGADVFAYKTGATRGPVFFTGSIKNGVKLAQWLKKQKPKIRKIIESSSSHITFKKMDIKIVGQYLFIRFQCDTDQAMGMNMITIGVQQAVAFISKKTDNECIAVAGNYDIDKKPAWLNMIKSRGFEVCADIVLTEKTLRTVLKTSRTKLFNTWLAKCMIGSAMSGSLGFNAHYANIVAAFFAATGQDLAHTVEGSIGITTMYLNEDKTLTVSIYIPSVMLGTVGGGTNLKTQSEALSITKTKTAEELACVLGGAVLAGELSLLASLSEGSLARAHKKLGR